MSPMIARAAFRAAPRVVRAPTAARRWASSAAGAEERQASKDAIKAGARRDPELYVLMGIMCGIFGLAGWHFSRSPTSTSSERAVAQAPNSEPWKEGGSGSGKYQYHPGGDHNAPKKDAPSALNVVIIPNVTLPKELHDKYNKWGQDGY